MRSVGERVSSISCHSGLSAWPYRRSHLVTASASSCQAMSHSATHLRQPTVQGPTIAPRTGYAFKKTSQ